MWSFDLVYCGTHCTTFDDFFYPVKVAGTTAEADVLNRQFIALPNASLLFRVHMK